jgi:demethylmenaquinone methyltransferase/2-methoxy-6-polyprenyl-1,4-benzoquinol methylase
MFDRIAPIYDLMNTLMTAGLDARWRRAAARAARLTPGMRALDVACGTGKLTRELAGAVGPDGEAIGVDVSRAMLGRAEAAGPSRGAEPRYAIADALAMPFESDRFDAVTVAFGLRNMPDYAAALREMARVALPGGRIVVLEIGVPATGAARALYETWFRHGVPLLGRLARRSDAYRYLPPSVARYPDPDGIAELMRAAGLHGVRWVRLTGGFVTLHRALKV